MSAPAKEPREIELDTGRLARKVRDLFANGAEMVRFSLQVLRTIPNAARTFPTEVVRQGAILVVSSGLVIWFMEFLIGVIFTVQGHYTTRQFGASGYVAIFPGYAGLRTCAPEMWGWILAAKVGCGFVAELGSMRANEEVDALEVMGIDPVSYLVSTRVLASILVMPFLFIVGLGLLYLGAFLMGVEVLRSVSPGGFLQVLWAFQSPLDLLFSMIWTMALGIVVVLVGCWYGFTATGGPVGVGQNTARSMVVNMVLVSLVGLFFQQLFWAGFPNAPVAN
ncbi:ABC transporter permease [Actinomycetospora sp. TBRC 11914]|uniref:ABC transporter permease n=1 Tax=Actinomycetospora sp. TBRC 11914 TaxID=2729387 RepID=UPI00289A82A2|nr:ABC transporter permease [Actinomycetospora sp. TBRC 11914]